MAPRDLKPIGFPQLCAIAKGLYEPGVSDSEWTARVKAQLASYRFASPASELVTRALRAVGHTVGRPAATWHPPAPRSRPVEGGPLSAREAQAFLGELVARGLL